MGVIELGLVTDHDETVDEPAAARRLGSPREIRRVLVAVAAALCLLLCTASAPPHSFAPAQLWSIPLLSGQDSFISADDQVYVFTGTAGGNRRLSAYGLRTGKLRWTVPELDDAAWIGTVQSGVIMLPTGRATVEFDTDNGGVGFREFNRETIAIDAATGRQLWRLPGEVAASHGDLALLTEWDEQGSTVRTLRAVGLHDGIPAWQNSPAAVQSWTTSEDLGRLVTATGEGLVQVLDFADGSVQTSRKLPWAGRATSGDRSTDISTEGQQLVVRNVAGSKATVTAYDLASLTERWHLTSDTLNGFYGCGPVMCLNDASGVAGYDRLTGRRLWQRASGGWAVPVGPDRLILEDGQEGARHALLDSHTGATLADLGTAGIVWDYQDTASTAYVLIRTTSPPQRTALGEVDEHSGEIRLRGLIDEMQDYGCHAEGTLLLCATADGRLTVTETAWFTAAG
ncbi:PQQ-binding-like beta-propeller repeat protein [Actinoplanes sp. TFC3]|uniref:outer membrane protein assembly factor BamB family protein n=1 Tax=Actinoplanes sp. TFC3 TaxID=1710355 RepID=UPI00082AC59A|nr:PQQ-binding-like beta-propeller repeat protein [Actinoplanes sp. TFC3]